MTGDQEVNEELDMEREEIRLLREFKEKRSRREKKMMRRRARIEHLRQLIQDLPDSDEMSSEEDRKIEREIEEA